MGKITWQVDKFKKEVRRQTLSYILAAFGLVAGLAWNEAVKALIEYLFPLGQNTLFAKFAYAALITLFLVVAASYLKKLHAEEK